MYAGTTIFLDATFHCVPPQFRQCIVVMVLDQATGFYVPIFYVLCTSKTQDTYWSVFNFIIESTDEKLRPATVVCDFKAALIKAVAVQFLEAQRVGCFFHFKQAVRRKMKKLSIPKKQIRVAMQPGVLDMLTVIKRKHIEKKGVAFVQKSIQDKCAESGIGYSSMKWSRFWSYFSKAWIKKYGPEVWNVHGLNHGLGNRTNNPLERFNREMNEAFSAPHPTTPVFVSTVERLARGHVQHRADTPSRARKKPQYAVQLPRAVKFESSEESDAACPSPGECDLGGDEYSDDSDSPSDTYSGEEGSFDGGNSRSACREGTSEDYSLDELSFEYEGDSEGDSDTAVV